jgi:hypothetical protein
MANCGSWFHPHCIYPGCGWCLTKYKGTMGFLGLDGPYCNRHFRQRLGLNKPRRQKGRNNRNKWLVRR